MKSRYAPILDPSSPIWDGLPFNPPRSGPDSQKPINTCSKKPGPCKLRGKCGYNCECDWVPRGFTQTLRCTQHWECVCLNGLKPPSKPNTFTGIATGGWKCGSAHGKIMGGAACCAPFPNRR